MLSLFVIVNVLQKKDRENSLQKYRRYEGVWQSADGKLTLNVYRITSGTLSFSLNNKRQTMRFLFQPHIPLGTVMNFPMHHSGWPALFIILQRGIAARVRFIGGR